MKKIILIICISLVACSHFKKENDNAPLDSNPAEVGSKTFNYQDFLNNFSSSNIVVKGKLHRQLKANSSTVTKDTYIKTLETLNSSIDEQTKKDLRKFNITLFKGYKNTFVICAYSKELQFTVCDDAICSTTEKYLNAVDDKTAELSNELPRKSCK